MSGRRGIEMLELFDDDRLRSAVPNEIGDCLERGSIVVFPRCPVELPEPEQLDLLRRELPNWIKKKNISYHPESDRISGLDEACPLADLVYEVLTDHRRRVIDLLRGLTPDLTRHIEVGTCSFRPLQEQGRDLKAHASNELVHVDAGAYGATNGDRILRFFVNVNPEEDRVWATKGPFDELLKKYGPEAGLLPNGIGSLERGPVDKLRSLALRGAAQIGLPLAKVLDSSPYDRTMRRSTYCAGRPNRSLWACRLNAGQHTVGHLYRSLFAYLRSYVSASLRRSALPGSGAP
jgi:hypothetical protein